MSAFGDDDFVLQTRGLTRVYLTGRNEVRALQGVDFSVRRGEMVAITGASGSGKSTLLHLLGCLDRPTSGTYVLDGVQVDHLGPHALADVRNRKVGIVFQAFNLLPRTSALDNVELPLLYDRSGRELDTRRLAAEALALVGLAHRMDHPPNELSGGQQQRVAIVRALAGNPRALLLDEITSSLDPLLVGEVLEAVRELKAQGVTMLIATHEMTFARDVADRVGFLHDGRIVELGPSERVLAEPRLPETRQFLRRLLDAGRA
jgi:ABC-type polar amino acid transport system ATPase subunit